MVFIMRQLQKRQQAEVGGSVVRAVGLMQGNTEMDGVWWQECREQDNRQAGGGKAKSGVCVCVW